jgi:hypothetical protein
MTDIHDPTSAINGFGYFRYCTTLLPSTGCRCLSGLNGSEDCERLNWMRGRMNSEASWRLGSCRLADEVDEFFAGSQ